MSVWVRDYVLHHADFVFRIADIRAALPGVSDQTIRLALDALKVDSLTADGVGLGSVWRRSVGTCQNCNMDAKFTHSANERGIAGKLVMPCPLDSLTLP